MFLVSTNFSIHFYLLHKTKNRKTSFNYAILFVLIQQITVAFFSHSIRNYIAMVSDIPAKDNNLWWKILREILSFFRSNRLEVLLGKSVLKICTKFTGEHSCRSAISIKLLCIFSEHHFLRTPLGGYFCFLLLSRFKRCPDWNILRNLLSGERGIRIFWVEIFLKINKREETSIWDIRVVT